MANITFNTTPASWTPGASWVGGVAPGVGDDALIIATSGSTVTIDAGSVARSADFNTYTGTLTSTAQTLTLGDATAGAGNRALRFVAGMTVTGTPIFSFISTSATVQTVDFAGKTTASVTFNAASNGSWQYTGGHVTGAGSTVTLTQGSLDVNGQTVTWGLFNSTNSNVRSLTLGAANITIIGGATTVFDIGTNTNMTLSAASSTITASGAGISFAGNGTFGTVNLTGSGIATVPRTHTFTVFNRTGTAIKTDSLAISLPQTITTTFTLAGNSSINRLLAQSSIVGSQRAITNTGATQTWSNVDLMDISLSTTYDASARTDIGDAGGNSGITFPAPVTQTATDTASFTWSTHGWSGGRVPLTQDDVVINNAFSGGQTITSDMPRLGRNLDFTGATGSPTFNFGTSASIFGSLTFISAMSRTGIGTITFAGRSTYTITSAGQTWGSGVNITAPGGTYTLQDPFSAAGAFNLNNGTFNANNSNVTFSSFAGSNSNTRGLTMGSGTWTSTSTAAATIFSLTTTTGLTFSGASSTFVVSGASVNTRVWSGGGLTYGTLTYTVAGSAGQLNISGSNTFNVINFSDITNARTLAFTAATTTTINGTFNVNGTLGNLMSVNSITAATHTLTSPFQQSCDYLLLTNSIATGGPWYAGTHSTDNGGNSGWIFTAPPASTASSGGAPTGSGGMQTMKSLQNLRNLI